MFPITPAKAPFPTEAFMKFSAKDQSTISLAGCDLASTAPCFIPVQVGLFFDLFGRRLAESQRFEERR